jgi:hypothetical protein
MQMNNYADAIGGLEPQRTMLEAFNSAFSAPEGYDLSEDQREMESLFGAESDPIVDTHRQGWSNTYNMGRDVYNVANNALGGGVDRALRFVRNVGLTLGAAGVIGGVSAAAIMSDDGSTRQNAQIRSEIAQEQARSNDQSNVLSVPETRVEYNMETRSSWMQNPQQSEDRNVFSANWANEEHGYSYRANAYPMSVANVGGAQDDINTLSRWRGGMAGDPFEGNAEAVDPMLYRYKPATRAHRY